MMRRWMAAALAALMVLSLAACAGNQQEEQPASAEATEQSQSASVQEEEEPASTEQQPEEPSNAQESGVLVAYFSWANNAILAEDVDAVASPSVITPGNVQQLADLTASVRELTVSVGNLAEKQGDMVSRVDALEKEPGKNWSALKSGILGAIAAAIGSGLVAAVIYFIK